MNSQLSILRNGRHEVYYLLAVNSHSLSFVLPISFKTLAGIPPTIE